mgnify:CR=1 FL=1|tara:strand:+ start:63 stop:476 length:414 start_codon:yes stop_codon:yes gene_type:complete
MMSEENKIKIIGYRSIIFYAIFFFFLGYFLSSWYRPYVYSNGINDYGLADIGNNISFVPGLYFLLRLFRQKFMLGVIYDIILIAITLILIELTSAFVDGIGTFDYRDIIGLITGAGITFGIMKNKKIILETDYKQRN